MGITVKNNTLPKSQIGLKITCDKITIQMLENEKGQLIIIFTKYALKLSS